MNKEFIAMIGGNFEDSVNFSFEKVNKLYQENIRLKKIAAAAREVFDYELSNQYKGEIIEQWHPICKLGIALSDRP